MKITIESITFKSHTYKVGDKVTESFQGHLTNDAEIIEMHENGLVRLRNSQGEEWDSNLVWLKPQKNKLIRYESL